MGKLDHQFWKPEIVESRKPVSARKQKKKRKPKKIDWQGIHKKACYKLKVSPHTSWNGLADKLCQVLDASPASTRNEARQMVKNYVERGLAVSRTSKPSEGFYGSQAWKELRYIALRNSDGKCNLCGASAKDGVILHVDHITPRSIDSKKELDLNNLQVLCEDCNIGKGNRDCIDWRNHWESI